MLFHLITIDPVLYWFILLSAFIGLARGWYCVGALGQVISAPAGLRPRVRWLFRPGMRMIAQQLADVTLLGKWESSDDAIAASIAIKLT
jgi:hypothetical protein